jgi:hypothetical protein
MRSSATRPRRRTAEVGGGAVPEEPTGDWDVTGTGAIAPQIAAGVSAPSGVTDWAAEGQDWAAEPHKDFQTAAAAGNPGNAATGWD